MATFHSTTDSRNYRLSLTITESSQNIANNQTTISYSLVLHALASFFFQDFASTIALTIDGVSLLNTSTQRVTLPSANSSTVLASGTQVITHNTDGTRSISFSSSFRTNSTTTFTPIPTHTISGSQALTTIPRASQPTLNVSSQALGGAITINTNRASTGFTHTLSFSFGNQSGTISTGTTDSVAWTLPNSLANAIPNGTSGSGTITCETYNGATLIGVRTVAFTATVPNNATFQPTAGITSITEAVAGLAPSSIFIQGISRLRVVSTGAGQFGASIAEVRITVEGANYWGWDLTTNVIGLAGTVPVTLTMIDSRGFSRVVVQNTTFVGIGQPTLNLSTQALGSAITISTNRTHTTLTHRIRYTFGAQTETVATGVTDSFAWTLPNSLANIIPNTPSGWGTISCDTFSGTVHVATRDLTFTATVPNNATFQPNASISSITEGQSGLTAFNVFIQNISRLRVQSAGSGNFGATISQQRVTIDGGHLLGTDVTFNPINKNGTLTVTLLVTDSRGYSRTVTQNVTLVAYFAPRINSFIASRSPNDQGTDLSAPVNFEIAPVSNQNTRLYRVRYRVSGGSWVLLFESRDFYSRVFTHTATGVLNANNSFEIELFVQDSFSSATRSVTIGTAFDLLNFNQSGRGIAIGKVSESDTFEVALPTRFSQAPTVNGVPLALTVYPIGAIYISTVSTSPATLFGGTWQAIENQFLIAAGATYPAGTTGGSATHFHTVAAHTHSGPSHTHTVAAHTHSGPSHTHTVAAHTHSGPSHTHTVPAHSHSAGGLFARFAFWSTTSLIMERVTGVATWADNFFKTVAGGTGSSPGSNTVGVGVGGATATDGATTTGAAGDGQTGSGGGGNTGAAGDGQTGSGGGGNTGAAGDGQTGSGGGGNTGSQSSLPPYLSVFMWRRTA